MSIDVAVHKEVVAEAFTAFASDPNYLVSMMEAARNAEYNRALWTTRREVSEAEEAATAQCQQACSEVVVCANFSACGFGDCIFAKAEHSGVFFSDGAGRKARLSRRPAAYAGPTPEYDADRVVRALLEERGVFSPKS